MLENFSLEEEQDFFIFGEPINTPYGEIRFYSFREYQKRLHQLSIISFSPLKFYYILHDYLKKNGAKNKELNSLKPIKKMELYDFLLMNYATGDKSFLEAYMTVFNDLIKNENITDFSNPDIYFNHMKAEQFYELREIIMRMNLLKEEKMSPNPTVQSFLEKSKRMKAQGKEAPTTETIMTSIFLETGTPYHELGKMTAFQIMSTYTRIHALKDFEMSSLFATVSGEVEIAPWDKNSTFFEEEQLGLNLDEVKKNYDKALG